MGQLEVPQWTTLEERLDVEGGEVAVAETQDLEEGGVDDQREKSGAQEHGPREAGEELVKRPLDLGLLQHRRLRGAQLEAALQVERQQGRQAGGQQAQQRVVQQQVVLERQRRETAAPAQALQQAGSSQRVAKGVVVEHHRMARQWIALGEAFA